jgi:hypothetical protein
MANYDKLKVKQLEELLRQRGLRWRGLNKNAMKQALMQDDQDCNSVNNDVDDEVVVTGVATNVNDDVTSNIDGGGIAGESEQITALRLQLEIARLNLQQAQLGQSSGFTSVPQSHVDRFDLSGV